MLVTKKSINCAGWNKFGSMVNEVDWWQFKSEDFLKSFGINGRINSYSGGGYIYSMNEHSTIARVELAQLEKDKWFDNRTKAIFIEFSTYNAFINMFSV